MRVKLLAYLFGISHFTTHWAKACSAVFVSFSLLRMGCYKWLLFSAGWMWHLNCVSMWGMIYTHTLRWYDNKIALSSVLMNDQAVWKHFHINSMFIAYTICFTSAHRPPLSVSSRQITIPSHCSLQKISLNALDAKKKKKKQHVIKKNTAFDI